MSNIEKVAIRGEKKSKNIIAIISQKGGSSKSSTAMQLISFLLQSGRTVCLVDADRQGTLARWGQDRKLEKDLPQPTIIQIYDDIAATLHDMSKIFDYVIVDTAGRDAPEIYSALAISHKAIVSIRPSQVDLDTLETMDRAIRRSKKINPNDLSAHILFTQCPTNANSKEVIEAREYAEDYDEMTVLKNVVKERVVYRHSASEGKGVIEMNDSKGIIECNNFIKEILKAD
ncbi:Plasmid stability protein ParA [Moritella sp. PE36]|uniref:division plane positioning ATPase MipZ n=1 Tax=Moritella sp. PE36 TaxID=58051 RepID=UPI000156928D|nr:division plane positioning ATPase MipZ [Moritella sp. PE36]EDM66175.1 Plasmid stability protein ParA [Moritella sp. PE36]